MLAAFASAFAFRDEPQSAQKRNQRMMMMRKRTFLLLRPAPRQLPRRPPRMHRLDTQTRPEPNRAARCQPKADTSAVVVHNCAELASCLLGNSIESRAASSDSGASKAATIVRVVPRPRQPSEVSGRPSECRIVCGVSVGKGGRSELRAALSVSIVAAQNRSQSARRVSSSTLALRRRVHCLSRRNLSSSSSLAA